MAGEPLFVDTNVLVNAARRSGPHHIFATEALARAEAAAIPLLVSTQVIREYVAAMSRLQERNPSSMSRILDAADQLLMTFECVGDTDDVSRRLCSLLRCVPCYGRQVHDANIVAVMQAAGIRRLLTFNVSDFRRFGSEIK
jgi:predicted nucleic acid-binding protein